MIGETVVCMLVCKCCVSLYVSVCCCAAAGDVTRNVRPSNRIQIRNLPTAATKDDIDELVSTFGTVKKSQLGMHSIFMLKFYCRAYIIVSETMACCSEWLI